MQFTSPKQGYTMQDQVTLTTLVCGQCGILFAMPEMTRAERQKNGADFYCPNGHCRVYRESDVEKARRALAQEQAAHDQTRAQLRDAAQKSEQMERRAKHGVCPCCRRTFQNLRNHMHKQHPEYGPPALNMQPRRQGRRRAR